MVAGTGSFYLEQTPHKIRGAKEDSHIKMITTF